MNDSLSSNGCPLRMATVLRSPTDQYVSLANYVGWTKQEAFGKRLQYRVNQNRMLNYLVWGIPKMFVNPEAKRLSTQALENRSHAILRLFDVVGATEELH